MDRNLVLAVSLSVGIYALWFGFIDKRIQPPALKPPYGGKVPPPAPAAGPTAPPARFSLPTVAPPQDRPTLLAEASDVRFGEAAAKIHPRGAAIVSFQSPEPLGTVELVESPDPGLFATFPELSFQRDPAVKNGLAFTAQRRDGLRLFKQFLPGEGTVLPRVRLTASNPTRRPIDVGPWTIHAGPGLGTIASEKGENLSLQRALALTPESGGLKGHIETLKPGEHPGPYRWIGIDNRYFLVALIPSAEHFAPTRSSGQPSSAGLFGGSKANDPPSVILTAKPVLLTSGGSFTWELPFYLGAKGHTWLSRYDVGLERAIDFGFFSQLGRWMLGALERLHRATGNWGWAIVLLTLGLQILMFPLTWKSLRAAAAMKKLQPEIARLQQRHADDPRKASAETMELYRRAGANPLGGCLPMLLQMPIFIALFNALRNSWELHGAGWILWIQDLSAKDPYYALPLVMGGLMFAQSKMNPPAGDPAQQKVMMLMPVIFTFMFLNFPSGLVLYWLTNSLVSTMLQIALKDRLEA